MDDAEDADLLSMLLSPPPPDLFELVSTAGVPGVPDRLLLDDRQLFTRIVRTKLTSVTNRHLARTVDKIIQVRAGEPVHADGGSYRNVLLNIKCTHTDQFCPSISMAINPCAFIFIPV